MKKKYGKTKWIDTHYAKPYKMRLAGQQLARVSTLSSTLVKMQCQLNAINSAHFANPPTGAIEKIFKLQKASAASQLLIHGFKDMAESFKASQPVIDQLNAEFGRTFKVIQS